MNAAQKVAFELGNLVIANANLSEQFEAARKKLATAEARIKELEDKYEPATVDPEKE